MTGVQTCALPIFINQVGRGATITFDRLKSGTVALAEHVPVVGGFIGIYQVADEGLNQQPQIVQQRVNSIGDAPLPDNLTAGYLLRGVFFQDAARAVYSGNDIIPTLGL